MQEKLEELIEEYKAFENCEDCEGKGYVTEKHENTIWSEIGKRPCMCLYVKDPEVMKVAVDELKEIGKGVRRRLYDGS